MQGNCSTTPPGSPLVPDRTSAMQCRVRVSKNFLSITEQLWLHDIYIEAYNGAADAASPATTVLEASGADVWLTRSVLVGDTTGRTSRAVHVTDGGRFYARGARLLEALAVLQRHRRCIDWGGGGVVVLSWLLRQLHVLIVLNIYQPLWLG